MHLIWRSIRSLLPILHRLPAILLLILSLHGCATVPKEAGSEESLRAVAEAYWKLRMEDKYEETYKREDRTGLPPFVDYCMKVKVIKKFNIKSYEINEIKVDANTNKGIVDVVISFYMHQVARPFKDVIHDEWVYKDGKWWHILPR